MDKQQLIEAVSADVVEGLGDRRGGFGLNQRELQANFDVLDDGLPGPLLPTDDVGVLAWKTETTHDGVFQGIAPTGRTVHIIGCTYVLGADPDEARYVRFVDWASVLAQMGVTFNTKPLVATDDPR